MNELNVIYKTEDLGRAMPSINKLTPITNELHYKRFGYFSMCDVWTADGWLITAIQSDGVTCHLRKGNERQRKVIDGLTIVYSNKNLDKSFE
jgi:hypothetical protein